jgi:hypothetical protein
VGGQSRATASGDSGATGGPGTELGSGGVSFWQAGMATPSASADRTVIAAAPRNMRGVRYHAKLLEGKREEVGNCPRAGGLTAQEQQRNPVE